ncbi:MAG TPA: dimethylmenaquinone methyltransferase [Chloroflexi bacterium]|nr:dimethylmenaquinone methyltransferase [Chloroflexota bacterium]
MPKLYSSPEEKAYYVHHMFARIANRYDLTNRVLSLGQDLGWRKRAARLALPPPQGRVLDLGTGTGEMALLLAQEGSYRVTALDFSPPMLELGRQKAKASGLSIDFLVGDALSLPFPDHLFDRLISAFVLRNLKSIPQGLAEICRVVRPGGYVISLELFKPKGRAIRPLYALYLNRLAPLLGQLITGDGEAYRYLPLSIEGFLTPQKLAQAMERAGLVEVEYFLSTWGIVAVHRGRKP